MNKVENKIPKCGNIDCGISTGIHEEPNWPGLTFGRGKLDFNGYWEIPCSICARYWEERFPEDGPCWPFSETTLTKIKGRVKGEREN